VIAEVIGALGVIAAAAITGVLQRWRNENTSAHGKALEKLDSIAATLDHVDAEIDEIGEWQREHDELHRSL
jgi:hypothetical protein